jgi:DNA-directed RNA polymerase delta subunit
MKLKEWYTLNEITEEERTLLEQIGYKINSKRLELHKKYKEVLFNE